MHVPFMMVHIKTDVPTVKPVIVVDGLFTDVIAPLPEIFVHVPKPAVTLLAAIVAVETETQIVLLGPAFAT